MITRSLPGNDRILRPTFERFSPSQQAQDGILRSHGGACVSLDGGEHRGPTSQGLLSATVIYWIAIDALGKVYAATPYEVFRLETR